MGVLQARYVAMCFASQMQLLVLAIPVLFLVAGDPTPSYFVRCGVIFLNDATVLLLIFGPKLRRYYDIRIWRSSQGTRDSPAPTAPKTKRVAPQRSSAEVVSDTMIVDVDLRAELDAANEEISMLRAEVRRLQETKEAGATVTSVRSNGE